MQDAIAESIRRQLLSFTSFIDENAATVVDIRPIFLDLIVDGISVGCCRSSVTSDSCPTDQLARIL